MRLLQPITKASSELRSARRVGPVLRELAALARSGRPGPVHLSVPANLWLQSAAPEPSGAHWPPPGRGDADASPGHGEGHLLQRTQATEVVGQAHHAQERGDHGFTPGAAGSEPSEGRAAISAAGLLA